MDGFKKFKHFEPLVQLLINKYAEQLNTTILSEDEFKQLVFLYCVEAFEKFGNHQDRSSLAFEYVNKRIQDALNKYRVD